MTRSGLHLCFSGLSMGFPSPDRSNSTALGVGFWGFTTFCRGAAQAFFLSCLEKQSSTVGSKHVPGMSGFREPNQDPEPAAPVLVRGSS